MNMMASAAEMRRARWPLGNIRAMERARLIRVNLKWE